MTLMADCPRCGKPIDGYPALSRVDNKTDICTPCGTEEALYNWKFPDEELPSLDRRARYPQD